MLIFLDFDGVLHPSGLSARPFSQLPILETFFRQPEWAHCQFVISSTWRKGRDLQQLRAPFSSDFQLRIIGMTPELPYLGAFIGSREREILAWRRDFDREHQPWIALDDLRDYFHQHLAQVYLCDGATGLTANDLPKLAAHLRRFQIVRS